MRNYAFEPNRSSTAEPGDHVVYTHTLRNTGNISDTYNLTWSTSRGWSTATAGAGGATIPLPGSVTLLPSQTALITVTVSVPTDAMTGTLDTTVVTATSPARAGRIVDTTLVPSSRVFMPVILRH